MLRFNHLLPNGWLWEPSLDFSRIIFMAFKLYSTLLRIQIENTYFTENCVTVTEMSLDHVWSVAEHMRVSDKYR